MWANPRKATNFLQREIIGLYVLIMSHTRFRANPHPIVAWMSKIARNRHEIWSLSDYNWTRTRTRIQNIYIHINIHIYIHINIHIYIYIYVYVYIETLLSMYYKLCYLKLCVSSGQWKKQKSLLQFFETFLYENNCSLYSS